MAHLSVTASVIALYAAIAPLGIQAADNDWYKQAVEEMKKPPPDAIYTRGDAQLFLGIPYAGPSNGSYAFDKPSAIDTSVKAYTDQLNLDFGPYCAQMVEVPGMRGRSFFVGQQDCLTLNVFQPRPPNATRRYPVYVVLHGGGLISGSARDFGVQGIVHNLVARNIVVVTVEYRLGAFGLFNFGDGGEGSSLRSLRDVLAALRWVQAHIGDFAGNASSVTLGGWDGGACLVSWLVLAASNKSNGISDLFHQAGIHSGSGDLCFQLQWSLVPKNASQQMAERLCPRDTNLKDPTALRRCMDSAYACGYLDTASVCEEKAQKCAKAAQMEPPDGLLFPLGPYSMYLKLDGMGGEPPLKVEDRNPIRIMLSWTRDEWATIHTAMMLRKGETVARYDKAYLSYQFSRVTNLDLSERNASATFNAIIGAYKREYKLNEATMGEADWYRLYVMFFSHYFFAAALLENAYTYLDVGQELLLYEFAHDEGPFVHDATAESFGLSVVGHGVDLPYVFMGEQYFKAGPHNPLATGSDDRVLRTEWRLADVMGHLIADFVSRRPTGLRPMEGGGPSGRVYWMNRISRRSGFASPVQPPLSLDIAFRMFDEWQCNFGAQYGEPPAAGNEYKCAKNQLQRSNDPAINQ